jgi:hypothetical protein
MVNFFSFYFLKLNKNLQLSFRFGAFMPGCPN